MVQPRHAFEVKYLTPVWRCNLGTHLRYLSVVRHIVEQRGCMQCYTVYVNPDNAKSIIIFNKSIIICIIQLRGSGRAAQHDDT